jgi:hypothetical protein
VDTDTRGGELDISGKGGGDCLPLTLEATDIRDAMEFLLDEREPDPCVLTLKRDWARGFSDIMLSLLFWPGPRIML